MLFVYYLRRCELFTRNRTVRRYTSWVARSVALVSGFDKRPSNMFNPARSRLWLQLDFKTEGVLYGYGSQGKSG